MKLDNFNYSLPEDLIAQFPLRRRDQSKLMIIDRNKQTIAHDTFINLHRYLPDQSMLVFNNSRVIPARLLGVRKNTGGKIEIFIIRHLADGKCEVLIKPLKRLKNGDQIVLDKKGFTATLVDRENRIIQFNRKNILKKIQEIGHMPLPPYIQRSDQILDKKYYQTVYAKHDGSVAAPTAGLHFTKRLIGKLIRGGVEVCYTTLHVGYGTFKPVEVQDIKKHVMHKEFYSMNRATWNKVKNHKADQKKIIAVGTTSCRVLETIADHKNMSGETDIFIYPSYQFKFIDGLITNFHLPKSTLLMLVSAFAGTELIRKVYAEAIKCKYRFYSYGDAMLII